MLRLLGRASSINVRKVLWTFGELEVPFTHEDVGAHPEELRTAGYLALNPNGKVPVLVDGDFVLWESNAVCRYLAARENRDDLLPNDPKARALVEQWMDWQTTDLNVSWRYAFLGLVRNHPAYRDPDAIAASVVEWNRHMRMLEERLARTGAYVTGDRFTIADVVLGLSTLRWKGTPIERAALPSIDAWFARITARPAFVAQRWGNGP